MNIRKIFVFVIHTLLLLFVLLFMIIWIPVRPHTYLDHYTSVINYEAVSVLRNMSCIALAVNSVISFATWFYSKAFFVIHLVLAEFCLAYIIISLFV